ncbi:unnamed protein product [Durusdinium trenchii]|uniref:Uncharacterized protein n=1 Tax=Durusdinium trenchii TaxID=1381693 RepID=A0ABP0NAR3_9DINO
MSMATPLVGSFEHLEGLQGTHSRHALGTATSFATPRLDRPPASWANATRTAPGTAMADVVRFHLGSCIEASRTSLAQQAQFFAVLADEPGPIDYGEAELESLLKVLSPKGRRSLPLLLEWLGHPGGKSSLEPELFSEELLFHSFAAAHLLGASQLLDAARYAAQEGRRLLNALVRLELPADVGSLRTAHCYGLDRFCGDLPLAHCAAEADLGDVLKLMLMEGEEGEEMRRADTLELLDSKHHTALHVCAMRDSAQAAKVLLEHSASLTALCDPPDLEEEEGTAKGGRRAGVRTALHLAAYHDSVEVLQLLLDAKADVASCVKGVTGALTPLHECATSDAQRCAQLLAVRASEAAMKATEELEKALVDGMEVDQEADHPREELEAAEADAIHWCRFLDPLQAKVGHHGSTPLHLAAESDAPGVVATLLEAKAEPQLGDDQGDTALHCAMLYGSPRALEALLERGASPYVENGSQELPLHLMAEFGPGDDDPLPPALSSRHFAKTFRAQTRLLEALAQRQQLAAALAHRAEGDLRNTPLHSVARHCHPGALHAVELLVNARADMEATNEEGKTPLAISLRRFGATSPVVALLRRLGARAPDADAPSSGAAALAGALGGDVRPLAPAGSMEVDAGLPIHSETQ